MGAFPRELECRGSPDAARRTGNDHNFAGQPNLHDDIALLTPT
jgi:hypothetical protein